VVSSVNGKENIDDYKGFYKTNAALSWILAIALFSLAGVPPTAGFFGKFFLLIAGASKGNYLLISFAALNMIISFYYYLRIVKAIFMDANENPIEKVGISFLPRVALYACTVGVLVTGVLGYVYDHIHSLTQKF
jgi:NADH-quinone oxidoreductase subunit N